MSFPVRLTAVLTHPIQYYAPWFRHIHAHAPGIALTVVYATQPNAEQQGVGFDRSFEWDVPLVDGYRSVTVRRAQSGDRIDTARFMGLDVSSTKGHNDLIDIAARFLLRTTAGSVNRSSRLF